jgi:ribosome-associated protein
VTDDDRSARQIARAEIRRAGDLSAKLARTLMTISQKKLEKLALDEELREAVDRARAIPSHAARRRAERTLAGELRRYDLDEVAAELAKLVTEGS